MSHLPYGLFSNTFLALSYELTFYDTVRNQVQSLWRELQRSWSQGGESPVLPQKDFFQPMQCVGSSSGARSCPLRSRVQFANERHQTFGAIYWLWMA